MTSYLIIERSHDIYDVIAYPDPDIHNGDSSLCCIYYIAVRHASNGIYIDPYLHSVTPIHCRLPAIILCYNIVHYIIHVHAHVYT